MADTTKLTNRIISRSILPLFKVIYAADTSPVKDFLKRFDGIIQFAVHNTDTGTYIEFRDGEIDVLQGVHPNPEIYIGFKDMNAMNALFTGGKPAEIGFPKLRGLWRIPLLIKLGLLFPGLLLLMPDNTPKTEGKKALKVKMTMYMVTNALSQLNKGGDEKMMEWTAKQPDRIYQLSVQPDGDAAYLRIRGGKTKSGHGTYKRKAPFIHMKFNGLDNAYKVLCEGKDTFTAMTDGDVSMDGSPEYGGALGSFMVKIQDLVT
ncbi:MAG: hypothetical protein U9P80_06595 [Thermodesulfobacteriota bacterium]|nr:hypothetical protein [Thermodesulfobacteriota bacterium]